MALLLVTRHGPTAWNEAGRIQGRSDPPLSPDGQAAVARWHLPDDCHAFRWITSPLRRARETASLLGHPDAEVEERLIEADWGAWEGKRLDELRQRLGADMVRLERKGLDFRPPSGESPRDVQARLEPLLAALAREARPVTAVTHKGVVRALYGLASGWDMTGEPPCKLRDGHAHLFRLDRDGAPRIERLNIRLTP